MSFSLEKTVSKIRQAEKIFNKGKEFVRKE